jgi:hypothetical protein
MTLLLGLIAGAAAAGASAAESLRVAGRVVQTSSICGGGAAISREQLERLPPPQPLAGKAILVVAGDRINASRPAARFVARADGTFVTRLPPGQWCFFDAARRPSEPRELPAEPRGPARAAPNIDGGCLEAEMHRCDLVLAVKANVSGAEINFPQRCSQPWNQPCYRGPMPP